MILPPPLASRHGRNRWLPALIVASLAAGVGPGALAVPVKAFRGEITLPTYPWAAGKHPYFRGTDRLNIYPYPMFDFLSREKSRRTYRTVVLENEYLRLTFLPELGGKIHEVIDKTTGQPVFYVNHVIKPGLIGQCGAWTSGGVEWNTGPQGHTVSCMQPVAVEILPRGADGSRAVGIGETERIYGTRWTVIVTLRPGRAFIEERIRIYNPTETVRPYYFWNCTAVPNPPGFRFIYPMTLGTDHGAQKFFHWPLHEGRDLRRGTNYQDASSIFGWHCDQDFFGAYDDGADRGVVAHANHHEVPGKKAWTWGQGGFGRMHQMDLTDDDGPYNEVQTGPLLTQGEVGRLDPCEAVTWEEWWYPVRGMGGFTFANRDVAVNATLEGGRLRLRMLGTGSWWPVECRVALDGIATQTGTCRLSPRAVSDLSLPLPRAGTPQVTLVAAGRVLARFDVPLALPERRPPEPAPQARSPAQFIAAAWQDFLLAHLPEAEANLRQALERDPASAEAHTLLALLQLDRDPATAAEAARTALATDPDRGLAHLALAVAEQRQNHAGAALDEAWKASLDPATAVAGRALAGALLLREREWDRASRLLAGPGPWETDPRCRGRRAFSLLRAGDADAAVRLARASLEVDPLDTFARSILWLAKAEAGEPSLMDLVGGQAEAVLDLAAEFLRVGDEALALRVLQAFYFDRVPPALRHPLPGYWAGALASRGVGSTEAGAAYAAARSLPATGVAPVHPESLELLEELRRTSAEDGHATLYLGHLLFHRGRHAEGRALWAQAAAQGAAPVIALRALGMASLTLDRDSTNAVRHLAQAHAVDTTDAIVARDLARVLFLQADQAEAAERKQALWAQARDTLQGAFREGQGRSDFVSLLARAHSRLGAHGETARLLDAVRVTVWEGSREVHDLFEEAHRALGDAHLAAGRPAEALAEFDRALEYPANLATGRLEDAREAHLHYRRGNALAALHRPAEAAAAWRLAAEEPPSPDPLKAEARQKARAALDRAVR